MRAIDILQFVTDPGLLGATFAGPSFRPWRIVLAAAHGLPLDRVRAAEGDDVLQVYQTLTRRREWPQLAAREVLVVAGRRSAKSLVGGAVNALFAALFSRPTLAPGEKPVYAIVATDRRQATVIAGYVRGLITSSPILRGELAGSTESEIRLRNGAVVEIVTASFRSSRGRTLIGAACDEASFWYDADTSSNPAAEILRAIRPGLATTGGALWLLSSPHAEEGVVYDTHARHYAVEHSPTLVVQAPTHALNPTFSEDVIADAYRDDPIAARSEYGAEFRSLSSAYVDRATVEACTDTGVTARPFERCWRYVAFLDAASGSGSDSLTLGIAHREQQTAVLDRLLVVSPPFSPERAVRQCADMLSEYRVHTVLADRWGGAFVAEAFSRYGIDLRPASSKSDLYASFLPLLNSRRVRLLDDERLRAELVGLQRKPQAGGREQIDHRRGQHDDAANAAAGALVSLLDRGHQITPVVVPLVARG